MRKVCLINNYNYGKYLASCLNSVVNQTTKFDAIYVVDDGSTDNSKEIIDLFKVEFPEITSIFKKNGGQLSCFNITVEYIEEDDLVFLLDADDIYPMDYVENLFAICHLNKYDMYFCNPRVIEQDDDLPDTSVIDSDSFVPIPNSSHLTRITNCWVGKPTSSMAVTGKLFMKVFPYPYESDWIVRADDILIFASSLAGCSKVFIPSLGIGYRSHGENSFFGKSFSDSYLKERNHVLRTLFLWCNEKYSLTRMPSLTSALSEYQKAKKYYQTIPKFSVYTIYRCYVKYLLRELIQSIKNNPALKRG